MSDVFEEAVAFAFHAHRGQTRKDGSEYILHPLEVATIVGTMSVDSELLAAAVLHDTVEDTYVTPEDILREFGERVADLVLHETENKRPEIDPVDSWKIRKEESLAVLKNGSIDCKMLWLGDKLSNIRALSRGYDELGDAVFDRFHEKSPKEHKWYYETILNYLKELSDYSAYKEYEELVKKVFGDK